MQCLARISVQLLPAQIVAFKITTIAPLILFIGMVLYLFVKNRFVKKIGAIILGFGLLFVGIYIMSEAVAAMPQLTELVKAFLERFNNPILCLLFGMVFTALIQSSSTSIGILQVIVASSIGNAAGLGCVCFHYPWHEYRRLFAGCNRFFFR